MKKTQVLFTVGLTSFILSIFFLLVSVFFNKKTETVIIKEQISPFEFTMALIPLFETPKMLN